MKYSKVQLQRLWKPQSVAIILSYTPNNCNFFDRQYNQFWGGFLGGSVVKNIPANAGDIGDVVSIPGSGRFSGGGNSLQYSCLENPMDRRAWWATVRGVAKSRTRLSNWARMHRSWSVNKHQISSQLALPIISSLGSWATLRQAETQKWMGNGKDTLGDSSHIASGFILTRLLL